MSTIKATWVKHLAFDIETDGHTLRVDTGGADDNTGPGPKILLLVSLAGCTGMDVAHLLTKMRVGYSGIEVLAEADTVDEHPKVYSEIRLVYRIFGEDIDLEKVEKAVALSQHKYCSVSAMLRKNCPIVYKIELAKKKS